MDEGHPKKGPQSTYHTPIAHKDQLYFWETNMPNPTNTNILDWVVLQAGNNKQLYEDDAKYIIGDCWSSDHRNPPGSNYFGNKSRPDRTKRRYFNNQGGWIATRRQVFECGIRWCRGGFL
jgi:hypothetical protein